MSLVLHAHDVLPWGETLQGLREWKCPRGLAVEEQLRPFGALGVDAQRAGEPLRRKQLHRCLAHHLDQGILRPAHRMGDTAQLLPGPGLEELQVDHEGIAELAGGAHDQLAGAGVGSARGSA